MVNPINNFPSEALLGKLNIDFPIKEAYVNAILEAKTPLELFSVERHMTEKDFEVIRAEAGKCNENDNFDIDAMVDDFKSGILFIEFIYAQIYHDDKSIEERPEQIRGSKAMYFNGFFKGNMLGEYPTGSGKSFMYLVFAVAARFIRNEATTIVTSGISLQEQLDAKDMPFISNIYKKITGDFLSCGILKGRQNYICNLRYSKLKDIALAGHKIAGISDPGFFVKYIKSIPDKFNGDISNVDISMDSEIKNALTIKSARDGGCKNCKLREKCYYIKAQKHTLMASIKVINYHMLFTEIDKVKKIGYLSGGVSNYIFDEAHEISSIGRDFSEKVFNAGVITSLKGKITKVDSRAADTQPAGSVLNHPMYTIELNKLIDDVITEFSAEMPGWFASRKSKFYDDIIIEKDDFLPVDKLIFMMCDIGEVIGAGLDERLEMLGFSDIAQLYAINESSEGAYDDALAILEGLEDAAKSAYVMANTLSYFLQNSKAKESDKSAIIWISKDRDDRLSLRVKNIDIKTINENIFKARDYSSVSVSATLSTNDTFKFFKKEVLLQDTSFEIISASPFDLYRQELWYMPKNAKSASKSSTPEDVYQELVVSNIAEILEISGGGMLALFTSVKAMRQAYGEISNRFPRLDIYIQGDKPRKHLIKTFRDEVNSVLFATRSFFTGIDIKGPSLRVLVLDKLPFENPSDPIVRTLSTRPNGFRFYSIPSMVMILKQIIGRGVRSKKDKCLILILDKRLKTSNYAANIRKSFEAGGNMSDRTHNLEDARRFLLDFMDEYGEEMFKSSKLINDNLDFLNK